MIAQKVLKNKIPFVILITVLVGLHIIWDYYNNGVPTHYLLAREDLPGISNWWGLLTIPLLSWILISLIQRQYKKNTDTYNLSKVTIGFGSAFIFGAIVSLLWELGLENILQFVILFPMIIALFVPIHTPGNFLGFVLGMTYTFGGVLPIGMGLILMILTLLIWIVFRKGFLVLFQFLTQKH